MDKMEYLFNCVKCEKRLEHPPVRIPLEVIGKGVQPFSYDIEYGMVCQECTVKLLSKRLFGLSKPIMDLKWLNPTGKDRWEENDIITHKEETK